MNTPSEPLRESPNQIVRILSHPWIHVAISVLILLCDLATGAFLQFPLLFVIPVCLSAWYSDERLGYIFAVLLPVGRFLIGASVEPLFPYPVLITNALVRIAVLLLLAYFVARTSRQTKVLKQRVSELVTICAWSRTIEYEGEWLSFEQYLQRRFGLKATHGISPSEMKKVLEVAPDEKHSHGPDARPS